MTFRNSANYCLQCCLKFLYFQFQPSSPKVPNRTLQNLLKIIVINYDQPHNRWPPLF